MKKWTFTICRSIDDCQQYSIPEIGLEDIHIQLLVGQLLRKFEELPEKAQELFRKEIKEI